MTTSRALLLRAAEIIEREAQAVFDAHSLHGQWVLRAPSDFSARADYDEMTATARELRRSAG